MNRRHLARQRILRIALVAGATLVACSFSAPVSQRDGDPGDAGDPDGPIVSCDAPTLSCSDGATLRASCQGTSDVLTPCPW
ncbi:MAG: hypothetical protein M3619_33555, partial [Myxococcota bacterium]|nr:hypothetical protein [Myxococcota bacterium]